MVILYMYPTNELMCQKMWLLEIFTFCFEYDINL